MRRAPLALWLVLLLGGCSRPPAAPALLEYHGEPSGFTIRYPATWKPVAKPGDIEVRFVPPDAATGAFIRVFTVGSESRSEAEIRRQVFALLPIHGVSGFQQDARTTPDVLWYKFELTGSDGSTEWASVGAAAAGAVRMQIAVCAKPLQQWREGQKECDEVIRSFQPGNLTNE